MQAWIWADGDSDNSINKLIYSLDLKSGRKEKAEPTVFFCWLSHVQYERNPV